MIDNTNQIGITPVIETIDPFHFDRCIREMRMAGEIGDLLARVYPGYYWLVNVDFKGQIATIQCGQINTEVMSNIPYSFVIHLKNLIDPSFARRKIINSAGELLERAFMRRGRWDQLFPTRMDGIQDNHQPLTGRKVVSIEDYRQQQYAHTKIEVVAA